MNGNRGRRCEACGKQFDVKLMFGAYAGNEVEYCPYCGESEVVIGGSE